MDLKSYKSKLLDEEYNVYTHKSGLKIYLYSKKNFSTCHAVFGTKFGSVDTSYIKASEEYSVPDGTAHFLEHKLFESETVDAFKLFEETGAYANAYTSFDKTCYLFKCSVNFYKNLGILLDFVTNPYFTEDTIRKEQGIIGQEIAMYQDEADWKVMFNMLKCMFSNHGIRLDIAGTKESIATINEDILYGCYNSYYNLSNMFLCIIGDFDEQKVLDLVDEKFKNSELCELEKNVVNEPKGVIENYIEEDFPISKDNFIFGFKDSNEESLPSVKKRICMDIIMELLIGDSSQLNNELLKKGYISSEIAAEYFFVTDASVVMFSGESKYYKEILDQFFDKINYYKTNGFDEKLFEIIKKKLYGNQLLSFDNLSIMSSLLVFAAVNDENIYDYIEQLPSITLDDLYEYLDIFSRDNCVLSVIKGAM